MVLSDIAPFFARPGGRGKGWIAGSSFQSMVRFIDNLVSYCESLALFPLRGMRRDDLLRHLRITHYRRSTIIAFRVRPDLKTVSIVGVFYGGQDYTALLQGDGNERSSKYEEPAEN